MAAVTIPESDYPGLAALVALKEESMGELLSALAEAPDVSDPRKLAKAISAKAKGIPPEKASVIAPVVISLSVGREALDYTAAAFAGAVCDAMEETGLEMLKLGSERPHLEENLARILSIDSLAALIKAQTILRNEYERVLCSVRILTDLRPVFGADAADALVGMGIVHNLRIKYHASEGLKEFFVALDGEELQEVANIVERAKNKEKNLKAILERAGIHRIEI
jgi:hypothetical protein